MSHAHSRRSFVIVLLWAVAPPAWADDKPLLDAYSEGSLPGETRPSPQLVAIVLKAIDKDDVEALDSCLADEGLKRADYASLLRAVKIKAGADHNLWFVRPALKPYCHALYGAHAFRYYLIEERLSASHPGYRLVYQHERDAFAIYPQQSHGLNDIKATGCIAIECRSARMSFNGREYRTVVCSRQIWNAKGEPVEDQRRCGSDDWEDDQSSGLEPSPGR